MPRAGERGGGGDLFGYLAAHLCLADEIWCLVCGHPQTTVLLKRHQKPATAEPVFFQPRSLPNQPLTAPSPSTQRWINKLKLKRDPDERHVALTNSSPWMRPLLGIPKLDQNYSPRRQPKSKVAKWAAMVPS
jgi:hypothetical protein